MSKDNFTYSPKANVFRKSYDTVHLTVILEQPANRMAKDMREAVQMLKDEIYNFLNDSELEEIFKTKTLNKRRQNRAT